MTSKEFWSDSYEDDEFRYSEHRVEFRELFEKYLPRGGSCFEVGCYPGKFLIYLGKRFNYTVNGIDWMPRTKELLQRRLEGYNIKVGTLVQNDFLEYHTDERYDVVCSFGFIEHFLDIERVIARHVELLKPGGFLIISSPNLKKAQYLLHRWLDEGGLSGHNLEAMDFGVWTRALNKNGMRILHQNYYGTFGFWAKKSRDKSSRGILRNFVVYAMDYSSLAVNRLIRRPSSAFSPHMISISKKMGGSVSQQKHL